MASFWKLIAQQLGVPGSIKGTHARRVAVFLGAQDTAGESWEAKIANFLGVQSDSGSWTKRMIDEAVLPQQGGSATRRLQLSGVLLSSDNVLLFNGEVLQFQGQPLTLGV